jgi:hypothetical protein
MVHQTTPSVYQEEKNWSFPKTSVLWSCRRRRCGVERPFGV